MGADRVRIATASPHFASSFLPAAEHPLRTVPREIAAQ